MFGPAKKLLDVIKAVNQSKNAAILLVGGIWIAQGTNDTSLRIKKIASKKTIAINFAQCHTLAEMDPVQGMIRVVAFSAMVKCAAVDPNDALLKLRLEYESGVEQDTLTADAYLASDERMKKLLDVLKEAKAEKKEAEAKSGAEKAGDAEKAGAEKAGEAEEAGAEKAGEAEEADGKEGDNTDTDNDNDNDMDSTSMDPMDPMDPMAPMARKDISDFYVEHMHNLIFSTFYAADKDIDNVPKEVTEPMLEHWQREDTASYAEFQSETTCIQGLNRKRINLMALLEANNDVEQSIVKLKPQLSEANDHVKDAEQAYMKQHAAVAVMNIERMRKGEAAVLAAEGDVIAAVQTARSRQMELSAKMSEQQSRKKQLDEASEGLENLMADLMLRIDKVSTLLSTAPLHAEPDGDAQADSEPAPAPETQISTASPLAQTDQNHTTPEGQGQERKRKQRDEEISRMMEAARTLMADHEHAAKDFQAAKKTYKQAEDQLNGTWERLHVYSTELRNVCEAFRVCLNTENTENTDRAQKKQRLA